MNLSLELSSEIEARLRELAQAEAKTPEQLALEALLEKLADGVETAAPVPFDTWLAEFRAFTAACSRRSV
jgi:predicted transcriptional regulator